MELRDFNYEKQGNVRLPVSPAPAHLAIFLPSLMITSGSLKVLQSIQTHRCLRVAHQRMNLVGWLVVFKLCLGHVADRFSVRGKCGEKFNNSGFCLFPARRTKDFLGRKNKTLKQNSMEAWRGGEGGEPTNHKMLKSGPALFSLPSIILRFS